MPYPLPSHNSDRLAPETGILALPRTRGSNQVPVVDSWYRSCAAPKVVVNQSTMHVTPYQEDSHLVAGPVEAEDRNEVEVLVGHHTMKGREGYPTCYLAHSVIGNRK